jgi:cytochrome c-type biogenesis protein
MNWSDWPPYAAVSLGLMTAISPCPLATNIAAVAFVSRRFTALSRVLADTVLYTVGRALAYTLLAILIQVLSLRVAKIANPLQTAAEWALGPVLIVVGLVLLGLFKGSFGSGGHHERMMRWSEKLPLLASFLLGFGFALAFCPLSASLYFGGLIPLAVKSPAGSGLALLYGIATALPVLIVGILLALGLEVAGKAIHGMQKLEKYSRPVVAVIFIAVGLYKIYGLAAARFFPPTG